MLFRSVIVQGEARQIARDASGYAEGKATYLGRFPDTEHIFELGDFSLFSIAPQMIRFIAGFGSARTLSLADWQDAIKV